MRVAAGRIVRTTPVTAVAPLARMRWSAQRRGTERHARNNCRRVAIKCSFVMHAERVSSATLRLQAATNFVPSLPCDCGMPKVRRRGATLGRSKVRCSGSVSRNTGTRFTVRFNEQRPPVRELRFGTTETPALRSTGTSVHRNNGTSEYWLRMQRPEGEGSRAGWLNARLARREVEQQLRDSAAFRFSDP